MAFNIRCKMALVREQEKMRKDRERIEKRKRELGMLSGTTW